MGKSSGRRDWGYEEESSERGRNTENERQKGGPAEYRVLLNTLIISRLGWQHRMHTVGA